MTLMDSDLHLSFQTHLIVPPCFYGEVVQPEHGASTLNNRAEDLQALLNCFYYFYPSLLFWFKEIPAAAMAAFSRIYGNDAPALVVLKLPERIGALWT